MDAWTLEPLAAAEGNLRARITDAHLAFDADVTVPIRAGGIDFGDATVEHVGPDSRMGVSRLGIYVDAPNGRSYLFQFPVTPVAGVEFEQRGTLLGPWVSDRGKLQLQPFAEALLAASGGAMPEGTTQQARMLFDRTSVSGEVRLGDGRFAMPGVRGLLAGAAEGQNVVRVRAEALGRGLTIEIASLLVHEAVVEWQGRELACEAIVGSAVLHVEPANGAARCSLDMQGLKFSGMRIKPAA